MDKGCFTASFFTKKKAVFPSLKRSQNRFQLVFPPNKNIDAVGPVCHVEILLDATGFSSQIDFSISALRSTDPAKRFSTAAISFLINSRVSPAIPSMHKEIASTH